MIKVSVFLMVATVFSAYSLAGEKLVVPGNGETLYLHCFRPTFGQKVILDPSDDKDATPAIPPTLLLTLKLNVGDDFDVIVNEYGNGISGKTALSSGKLVVSLQGAFGPSQHRFSGPVELERVFDPELTAFASAVMPFRCVLSKHNTVKPFLEAQSILDKQRLAEATQSSRKYIESQNRKAD